MKKIAIIPAAGSSSRFRELGKQYAKTVLPYEGRPIIAHIIDRISEADPDISLIFIMVNNIIHKNQIEEAIRVSKNSDKCKVCLFTSTEYPRGPGETIMAARPFVLGSHFTPDSILIHLSDSLFSVEDIRAVTREPFNIGVQEVSDHSRWCMTDGHQFYNKPEVPIHSSDVALSGLYQIPYFPEPIFGNDGESQISSILEAIDAPRIFTKAPIELDFGTLEVYQTNRGIDHTRSFNSIVMDVNGFVIKTSSGKEHCDKLRNEINWYKNIPEELAKFTPRVFNSDVGLFDPRILPVLKMERLSGFSLRDIALYLDRSRETWDKIFSHILSMVSKGIGNSEPYVDDPFWERIFLKTEKRLYQSPSMFVNDESKEFIAEFKKNRSALLALEEVDWIHGDLHFANIFFDFGRDELKVIDPRGDLSGDFLYDIAKLNHSVYGNYDCIDSQLYYLSDGEAKFFFEDRKHIQESFEQFLSNLNLDHDLLRYLINMITASLFLSMIPLHSHSEDNQKLYYKEFQRFYRMAKERK